MLQPDASWRSHVAHAADTDQIAHAKFPAMRGESPDGSPAWVELVAHQFQDPGVFFFTCENAADVRSRLYAAHKAAMNGNTKAAFDVVAVTCFANGGRTLLYKVSLEQVMVEHLGFASNLGAAGPGNLLEVGMTYQNKTGFVPAGAPLVRLRRIVQG